MNDEASTPSEGGQFITEKGSEPDGITIDAPRILESRDLLAGRQEILIRHQGELYRLRLTRNDKLILNK